MSLSLPCYASKTFIEVPFLAGPSVCTENAIHQMTITQHDAVSALYGVQHEVL